MLIQENLRMAVKDQRYFQLFEFEISWVSQVKVFPCGFSFLYKMSLNECVLQFYSVK